LYEEEMTRRRASTTAKKAKTLPKGVKLTCPGRHRIQDMLPIFLNAIQELNDRNIKHISGLNIYLITVDGPYRSAAEEHGL
jgi:hypothetical protein